MSRATRAIRDHLNDVLEYAEKTQRFTSSVSSAEELERDDMRLMATVRALEIVGEAVKRKPHTARRKYPQVPWKDIAGMRDILAHGYHDIDVDIVWKTIQEDVIPLQEAIRQILENLEE
ncbi:MAG: DUF86 domain-containing protein [Fimbriimonadia bacterium]|nr:DUF86 domain-containing protein [Fimbriimonadia bacterium]